MYVLPMGLPHIFQSVVRLAYRLVKPLERLTESMAIVETGDFLGVTKSDF